MTPDESCEVVRIGGFEHNDDIGARLWWRVGRWPITLEVAYAIVVAEARGEA